MSYDVNLVVRVADDYVEVTPSRNYTYNVSPMLAEALEEGSLNNLDWTPAAYAGECLAEAIRDLTLRPEHYDTMNPDSGWGSRTGCVAWLEELLSDCQRYPTAIFRVR